MKKKPVKMKRCIAPLMDKLMQEWSKIINGIKVTFYITESHCVWMTEDYQGIKFFNNLKGFKKEEKEVEKLFIKELIDKIMGCKKKGKKK